ncbi:MAG: M48 family metalloprotease [bacterium]
MHRAIGRVGLLAAGLLLAGCVTNPATQQKEFTLVTEAQEIQMGQQAHGEILKQFGQYEDSALGDYVAGVGGRIASISHRKQLPYRFTILDSSILNAFALPGGGIYVTRGLLAALNSEAELAAVLGHEVGHVTARHGAQAATRMVSYQVLTGMLTALDERLAGLKPLSDTTAGIIFLKYGRDAEYQADQLGAGYSYEAGYDPRWLGAFLRSLAANEKGRAAPLEFLSTHPSTPNRVARADALAAELTGSGSKRLEVGANGYKERLEGLLYGPGPEGWVWSGKRLANQAHRIALTPPEGWKLRAERLAFSIDHHRLQSAGAEWRIHRRVSTIRVESFAGQVEERIKLESADRSPFRLGPLEGLKVRYAGRSQGTDAVLIMYYALDGQTAYTFSAIAPKLFLSRLEPVYDEVASSLVKLTAEEAKALPMQRVHLERVRSGEGLTQLVRRVYGNADHVEAITLLNGLSPESTLADGSIVKVILPSPIIRRSE